MKTAMEYKSYTGSIEYSDKNEVFFRQGTVDSHADQLPRQQRRRVAQGLPRWGGDYLAMCEEKNIPPEQPFKEKP